MKRLIFLLAIILQSMQLLGQDTLSIASASAGYFTTISVSTIDSAQYQETSNVTMDGGTQVLLKIQDSGQRLAGPLAVEETKLHIYPNPGKGIYTINSSNFSIARIEVYSIIGTFAKTIRVPDLFITDVDISELNKGVYFFRITAADGTSKTQKVVFQ